jgi:DNA-binding SARP family transcriptional activator
MAKYWVVLVELRILGALEIVRGSGPETPRRRMVRQFLGVLALRANTAVSTDRISDGLWNGEPPRSAAANLRSYLADARRLVGDGGAAEILSRPGGHLLRIDPSALDSLRFGERAAAGRRSLAAGRHGAAAQELTQALGLWRGPVLAGLELPPGVRADADLLEDHRLDAVEDCVQARLALGQEAELSAELSGLVARYGQRERLWRLLMVALYRSGRQGDALAAYRRLRTILDEELGVRPHPDTERVFHQLLTADPALSGAGH